MARAIRTVRFDDRDVTVGFATLSVAARSSRHVEEAVHDGDTVNVRAAGDLGVRLLGIDTPEVSFLLPTANGNFTPLSDPRWEAFFGQVLQATGPLRRQLPRGLSMLLGHKLARGGVAANQLKWARAAERHLERCIAEDVRVMQTTPEKFRLFMAFAHEVMDAYGRFLCFLNRDQPLRTKPTPRPPTYNERLLSAGLALPYFIWPNVDPWRRAPTLVDAVPPPHAPLDLEVPAGEFHSRSGTAAPRRASQTIEQARQHVRAARAAHRGCFDAMDPLILEPFELRFLARQQPPTRWVIDLNARDGLLRPPVEYHTIPHPEDRLWVPAHFVPLFQQRGWRLG